MKPCPICSRDISENKELCLACKTTYGSLANFLAAQTPAEVTTTIVEEPTKRVRKPRAKKVADFLVSAGAIA